MGWPLVGGWMVSGGWGSRPCSTLSTVTHLLYSWLEVHAAAASCPNHRCMLRQYAKLCTRPPDFPTKQVQRDQAGLAQERSLLAELRSQRMQEQVVVCRLEWGLERAAERGSARLPGCAFAAALLESRYFRTQF